jgi:signal transduction protein with GAF and PtsI domain
VRQLKNSNNLVRKTEDVEVESQNIQKEIESLKIEIGSMSKPENKYIRQCSSRISNY